VLPEICTAATPSSAKWSHERNFNSNAGFAVDANRGSTWPLAGSALTLGRQRHARWVKTRSSADSPAISGDPFFELCRSARRGIPRKPASKLHRKTLGVQMQGPAATCAGWKRGGPQRACWVLEFLRFHAASPLPADGCGGFVSAKKSRSRQGTAEFLLRSSKPRVKHSAASIGIECMTCQHKNVR
jgi:hypothetical protein